MLQWNFAEAEWLNPPSAHQLSEGILSFSTRPHTDFWQRTYYGYQNNTGHALLLPAEEKKFTFTVHVEFTGGTLYDQAGLMIYQNQENWIKAGGENADESKIMIGSVVTNNGYSDWAISSMSGVKRLSLYYRLSRINGNFLIEMSKNGKAFTQMRTFHLFHGADAIRFGVYACSPLDSSFKAIFSKFLIAECVWSEKTHI